MHASPKPVPQVQQMNESLKFKAETSGLKDLGIAGGKPESLSAVVMTEDDIRELCDANVAMTEYFFEHFGNDAMHDVVEANEMDR